MTTTNHQLGRFLEGRYRIDALVGIGSSASVYLAYDTRLRRRVAAKLLHPGLASDAAFVRRFTSEAQAVAALNHPNIVHVYDWGEETDGPFLILEYLAGGTLKDLLDASRSIDVSQATAIGIGAADALAYAHSQGMIHRDVKPANLLFDEHGSVHVADFGLARTIASVTWTEPTGVVLGTARYASPEQALGRPLDGESDVYSLALVIYEALTGDAPFAGETAFATLMNRVDRSLPANRDVGLLLPLLQSATRQNPKDRTSAGELAASMRQLSTTLPQPQPLDLSAQQLSLQDPELSSFDHALDTVVGSRDDLSQTLSYERTSPAPFEAERARAATANPALSTESQRAKRSRLRPAHRRQSSTRLVIVGVALLIVLAVGAFAITRFAIFDHSVPQLTGVRLATAQRSTKTAGLQLRVVAKEFSTKTPAGVIISQSPKSGVHERSGTVVRVAVSQGPHPVSIPKVVGKTKATAVKLLTSSHLTVGLSTAYNETIPVGTVISTTPSTGSVPYGSKVSVLISLGPPPRTIPQFSDDSYAQASAQLSALELVPAERQIFSTTVQAGIVISTNPAEGSTGVLVGSRVVVTVSKGPRVIAVPTVSGEPISQAVATLQQDGLVVNEQIGPPFATTATTTDPAPGTVVDIGTSVTLYVG